MICPCRAAKKRMSLILKPQTTTVCVRLCVCVLCVFALARARAMRMRDKKDMLRVDGDKLTGNCRWFPRTQELLSLCFRSLRRAPRSTPPYHTGRAETVKGGSTEARGASQSAGLNQGDCVWLMRPDALSHVSAAAGEAGGRRGINRHLYIYI